MAIDAPEPAGAPSVTQANQLSSRIREARERNHLTQELLGERLGVRPQTIGRWERGEAPQRRFFGPLAELVGVPERDLPSLLQPRVGAEVHLFPGSHTNADGNQLPHRESSLHDRLVGSILDQMEHRTLTEAECGLFLKMLETVTGD